MRWRRRQLGLHLLSAKWIRLLLFLGKPSKLLMLLRLAKWIKLFLSLLLLSLAKPTPGLFATEPGRLLLRLLEGILRKCIRLHRVPTTNIV